MFKRPATLVLLALAVGLQLQHSPRALASDDVKPFQLVGEWTFTNSSTGQRFGGAVLVKALRAEGGSFRGTVSYDGRQTNDGCSTRGFFSDEPVEAEIVKSQDSYRVFATLNCLRGETPRKHSFTFVCREGVCSQPLANSTGTGAIELRETFK